MTRWRVPSDEPDGASLAGGKNTRLISRQGWLHTRRLKPRGVRRRSKNAGELGNQFGLARSGLADPPLADEWMGQPCCYLLVRSRLWEKLPHGQGTPLDKTYSDERQLMSSSSVEND